MNDLEEIQSVLEGGSQLAVQGQNEPMAGWRLQYSSTAKKYHIKLQNCCREMADTDKTIDRDRNKLTDRQTDRQIVLLSSIFTMNNLFGKSNVLNSHYSLSLSILNRTLILHI